MASVAFPFTYSLDRKRISVTYVFSILLIVVCALSAHFLQSGERM
jgi:hypothetical protein